MAAMPVLNQDFPLIAPQLFRIALRRKMLYEQGLDREFYLSPTKQNLDQNESRLYGALFTVAASKEPPNFHKRLCGLPTPPSTPEYETATLDWGATGTKLQFEVKPKAFITEESFANYGLQVVPETIPDESNVQDIIPWLNVRGSRDELQYEASHNASFATFASCSRRNPPTLPSGQPYSNEECAFPTGPLNADYQECEENIDQYSGANYSGNFSDQRGQATHLSSSPASDLVPDCLISPVSPSRPLRYYYHPGAPAIRTATVPLNRVKPTLLFAHQYEEYQDTPSPRSNQEHYCRQFAYENMRSQHEFEDMVTSGIPKEPELSRATHNVLERQRRNELKLRFNILRDAIPELKNNDKTPKIQILNKSLEYLSDLKCQEQRLLADLELEKQRKIILLRRMHALSQVTYSFQLHL